MKVGILAGGVGLKWICLGPWLCKKTKLYPSMVTPIWIKSCFIVIWNVISHLMSELCFYMQNTPTLGYCRHGEGGDMLQWDVTFKGPKGLLRSWYEIRQIWNMKFSSHVLLLAHCAVDSHYRNLVVEATRPDWMASQVSRTQPRSIIVK